MTGKPGAVGRATPELLAAAKEASEALLHLGEQTQEGCSLCSPWDLEPGTGVRILQNQDGGKLTPIRHEATCTLVRLRAAVAKAEGRP